LSLRLFNAKDTFLNFSGGVSTIHRLTLELPHK
jgi:hypothetical protein